MSVRSPVPQPPRRLPALANTTGIWRRSWIAVAHADEVPDNTPVQVLAGGDAWVLTRMDGVLTAFDDHCPHRQSPLSAGSVTRADDGSARLSCAFHGWRFDPAGQCDLMPEEDRGHAHGGGHGGGHHHHRWQGKRAGHWRHADRGSRGLGTGLLAAYGVVERYGLVWLAADEPLAPLPEFPEWEDGTAGRATCQSVTVGASAGQVIDRFLGAEADEVATDGWRVTGVSRAESRDGGAVAVGRAIKTAGPHATAHLRLELPHATIGVLVSCQPEDWGTTRVYKLITHSGLASGTAAMGKFTQDESQALASDLSATQGPASAMLPPDPGSEAPGARAGQLNVAWRRLMARAAGLPPGLTPLWGSSCHTSLVRTYGMRADLVLRSARVALGDGVRPGAVVVRDGIISEVADYGAAVDAAAEADLGDTALLPGLVDSHVHVNEPGRTDWEGFASATAAALAGGITTICDMPLNCVPVTTTVEALKAKLEAARGQCAVDVAFWGGAVPGNADQIGPLLDAGVTGLKCFLIDSGIPEFPPLDRDGLRAAMRELAGSGAPMIVHAESPGEVTEPSGPSYDEFVASRPPVAERRAIETVISAAAATGARAHIVHLAAGECAALIGAAQASGVALTAETCPHYLFFAAEEVPAGHTEFKCCPPVRYAPNREALWRALEAGVIGGIVSDHSPCTADLKRLAEGDFRTAWGGIASLQVALPATWSVARMRGRTLSDIARWMSQFPASLAGLSGRKGMIAPGLDADLVAFDPEATFVVRAPDLLHKNPVSPYDGRTLAGVVRRTWLRGTEVTPGGPRHGQLLRRGGSALDP